MTGCEFRSRCVGLEAHLSDKPSLHTLFRAHYCEGERHGCARYVVALAGPHAIPNDLLPNQHHRLGDFGISPHLRPRQRERSN